MTTWRQQLDATWQSFAGGHRHDLVAEIALIVDDPTVPAEVREFELACANDSSGRSDLAVPGYRRAIELGLAGYERRRATIQLASSLRNIGRADESVALLCAERTDVGDGLDDGVAVFLSLALVDTGAERAAVATLVHALAGHLTRYSASAHRYADALVAAPTDKSGQ